MCHRLTQIIITNSLIPVIKILTVKIHFLQVFLMSLPLRVLLIRIGQSCLRLVLLWRKYSPITF